jgi:hypothetical protein
MMRTALSGDGLLLPHQAQFEQALARRRLKQGNHAAVADQHDAVKTEPFTQVGENCG